MVEFLFELCEIIVLAVVVELLVEDDNEVNASVAVDRMLVVDPLFVVVPFCGYPVLADESLVELELENVVWV